MKTKIWTALFFNLTCALGQCGEWTSADGRTITADFIKLAEGKVHLLVKGKLARVALEELSPASRSYAGFLQQELAKSAMSNSKSPILTERMLQDLLAFDPDLVEGKNYLVEGHVERIAKPSGPPSAKVEVTLNGKTRAVIDYADVAGGGQFKIKIGTDSVLLMGATGRSGGRWVNFTSERKLIAVGQPVVIRARVQRGKIVAQGKPTSQEETTARLAFTKQSGGLSMKDAVELERAKIRINFLEKQLSGNAGSATVVNGVSGDFGTVTFEFSEAEKEAMEKELELLRAQIAVSTKK